ncbi:MAG: hypothetical protein V7K90_12630 [Nostoc sp.]|uniref:hypothetical protein n=1 Tax=Nostoc sp. TaxID=1180 RepID=UPI002FF9EEDB
MHWCQLKVKARLEQAFRDCLEKKSLTGNAYVRAAASRLAAEPQSDAFPASAWKRGFKGVLA